MPRWPKDWRGKTWKSGCCRNKWTLTEAEVRKVYEGLPVGKFDTLNIPMRLLGLDPRRSASKRKAQRVISMLNEAALLKRIGRHWQKVPLS